MKGVLCRGRTEVYYTCNYCMYMYFVFVIYLGVGIGSSRGVGLSNK